MIIEISDELVEDLKVLAKHYNVQTPQQAIMHGIKLLKAIKAFNDEGHDVHTSRPGTNIYTPLNVWANG